MVVFSFLLISKRIISLSESFFGRNPSNVNLEDEKPLETRAVSAADGPGMQITFIPTNLASLTSSSPGSQIPGIPASLTKATDFPSFKPWIIFGILFMSG